MPTHTKVLQIAATLGSPAAECANFGVCTVEVLSPEHWNHFRPAHLRHVKATLHVESPGVICFAFDLESMRTATRRRFFPNAGFQVDAPLILPPAVCAALCLPELTSFLPGVYAILEQAPILSVMLPLNQHHKESIAA